MTLIRDNSLDPRARSERRIKQLEQNKITNLSDGRPRIIVGQVTAAGAVSYGSGWSVTRTGVGDYTIGLVKSTATGGIIIPSFTPVSQVAIPVIISNSTSSIWVRWVNTFAGGVVDVAFSFIFTEV